MEKIESLLRISEEVQDLIRISPNKPIAEMNIIELLKPNEVQTSGLFEMLFSYRNQNNEYQILKSFAQRFLEPLGFDINNIRLPEMHREKKHIDLWVVEHGKYAVIFENKLKGACFQRNQLARYIQTMRALGYADEQIYVVLIPKNPDFNLDGIRDSVWKFPQDALTTSNYALRCAWKDNVSCWCDFKEDVVLNKRDLQHCKKCDQSFRQKFAERTVILKTDFSAWLIDEEQKIDVRERNVRSTMLQFADYLDLLYNNRLNNLMKNEIDKFLIERLHPSKDKDGWMMLRERLRELEELERGIDRVRYEVSRCLIDRWYDNLKDKWQGMQYVPHESFGYIIDKKIWVGCKFYYEDEDHLDMGDEGQPFWGFTRTDNKDATQAQIKLVKRILSQCENLSGKGNWDDGDYIVWNNTLNGDLRCDELFATIKGLGFI